MDKATEGKPDSCAKKKGKKKGTRTALLKGEKKVKILHLKNNGEVKRS